MNNPVYFGNAVEDGDQTRGWFVGDFWQDLSLVNPLQQQSKIEIKYVRHGAGEKRSEWSVSKDRYCLGLVLSGKMKFTFKTQTKILKNQEYFISSPGEPHQWEVLEDTLVLSIKWRK